MASLTKLSRPESKSTLERRMSSADERECLARALQANIVYMVDNLLFTESNLPELLISNGQITEDECRQIRSIKSRKDQIRYLINRTKGRALKDIKKVIELIGRQIPDVVVKIYKQFEDNKNNHVRCTTCALCQCFTAIDIKDVIDYIWSKQAISDGFYNEVILNNAPRGCQTDLWKRLIDALNKQKGETRKEMYDSLFSAIMATGRFDFLVNPMRRSLNQCNGLECKCFSAKVIRPLSADLTDSESSSMSSISARSSTSARRSSISTQSTLSTRSDSVIQEDDNVEAFPSVKNTTVTHSTLWIDKYKVDKHTEKKGSLLVRENTKVVPRKIQNLANQRRGNILLKVHGGYIKDTFAKQTEKVYQPLDFDIRRKRKRQKVFSEAEIGD